ncbi:unnamed protein product [Ectocarpus fasciculatus]
MAQSSTKFAPLDTADGEKTVWLVKLPQFVAQRLENADNGDVVGSLQLTAPTAGSGGPQVGVQISFDGPTEEFHLAELPAGSQVIAFSANQDKFKVKGKISKTYNMNPKDTEEYRRICRERRLQEAKSNETRALKVEDVQNQSNAPREVDFIPPVYTDAKRGTAAPTGSNKRQRGSNDVDSRDVRNKLLQAFSLRERLTLREINGVCQVPESQLKEQLKTYATFNSKGIYKNYWELKPEFKASPSTKN